MIKINVLRNIKELSNNWFSHPWVFPTSVIFSMKFKYGENKYLKALTFVAEINEQMSAKEFVDLYIFRGFGNKVVLGCLQKVYIMSFIIKHKCRVNFF